METNNKLRDALERIASFPMPPPIELAQQTAVEMRDVAIAALAEPPCNGEVGTVDERFETWQEFCGRYDKDCTGCPCKSPNTFAYCFAKWAQMPYKEGAIS
jgi:hypothetical protein